MTAQRTSTTNVNVTLEGTTLPPKSTFPCPLCGCALELRESRTKKPYSICNSCGIQIFFRGKVGISRLRKFCAIQQPSIGPVSGGHFAALTFSRLEQLRAQKKQLEQKRPFILADKDLENAICAIDREIAETRLALSQMASARR